MHESVGMLLVACSFTMACILLLAIITIVAIEVHYGEKKAEEVHGNFANIVSSVIAILLLLNSILSVVYVFTN